MHDLRVECRMSGIIIKLYNYTIISVGVVMEKELRCNWAGQANKSIK